MLTEYVFVERAKNKFLFMMIYEFFFNLNKICNTRIINLFCCVFVFCVLDRYLFAQIGKYLIKNNL